MSATRQTKSSKFSLPAQPSLEHLRKLAKQRLAKLRAGVAGAQLCDAQMLLAREYGFSSWRALKAAVEAHNRSIVCCRPPLNRHRVVSSQTASLERVGMEHVFFNFVVLGMMLTCMATPVDLGVQKAVSPSNPGVVNVQIIR